tara:strand:- start:171 stop:623 length:453 start_codon:yes stop_codon:yes gene_type:complete
MGAIKTFYIDEIHSVNIQTLKSRILNRQFNLSTNAIVGFINNHEHTSITFIFEKKCNKDVLLCVSKLFLNTIRLSFPGLFSSIGFELILESNKMSKFFHYEGSQSSIFAHSIILRPTNESWFVAHSDITPKDFAITTLNQFQTQLSDIFH